MIPHCVVGQKLFDSIVKDESGFIKQLINVITEDGKYPTRDEWARHVDLSLILDRLEIKPTDTVLEVGAWPTFIFDYVATLCHLTVSDSYEWAERGYKAGRNNKAEVWIEEAERVAKKNNATIQQMDIQKLSSYGKTFDKIYSVSVLEHVVDDLAGLKETFKILNPGGIFSFTTEINIFTNMSYRDDIMLRVYRPEDVISLGRQAGFKVDNEVIIPDPDDRIYKAMLEAKGRPDLLIYPYKHFTNGVFTFKKE
jgi:SAM-dependent methyltransferase